MAKDYKDGLPQVLIDYFNYLAVIHNTSKNTLVGYATDLRLFVKFLYKHKLEKFASTEISDIDISDCDADFLGKVSLNDTYEFLVFCKDERNNGAAARNRKATSIRRLYNYLYNIKNLIPSNPLENLDSAKQKSSLPVYLTLEQSRALLNSCEGKYRPRDYAILTLFLNCGMRLSELVSLNLTDIRSDNTMRVTGKGNKERTIYLNKSCVAAISDYLKYRPVDGVIDKNALFLSNRLTRINKRQVERIVDKCLERAGLAGQGFSTHKLRHTAATLMYQYGDVDVLLLKEILGHESTSTTEIYTHILNDQLKAAVDSNPLNTDNDIKD